MKKSDLYKKINRNNNTLFYDSNQVSPTNLSPDLFVDHVWLHDNDVTTGVQIIELKSSESDKSVDDDKDNNVNHKWSYAQEKYEINELARERRRYLNYNTAQPNANDLSADTSECVEDFYYKDAFLSGSRGSGILKENAIYNHQMNCFTILDKHFNASDSSEDDYADIEVIECGDPTGTWSCNSNTYDPDIMSYNADPEQEKRTVWIYSFKNKRLLSDHDFELLNIPSQDNSNSTIEDCQEPRLEHQRAATPVPPLHVPRLHLPTTPTLPTVTEVTETGKLSSSNQTEESNNSFKDKFSKKTNNWFLSEHVTPTTDKIYKADKSTSIINWMALSPREKRRIFRNTSPIPISHDMISPLPTLKEVSSYIENNEETKTHNVTTVIHEDSSQVKENIQTESCPQSKKWILEQIGGAIDTARKSFRSIKSNSTPQENHTTREAEVPSARVAQDRGDHKRIETVSRPPRIKISPKPISKNITNPIENLDSDDWIREEKLVKECVNIPASARGDGAGHTLWIRNMQLLKPAQWTEYLPITGSVPSLDLSMNTDSVIQRLPWYKRIINIFRCCK